MNVRLNHKSLTILELIIAVILLSIVVLGVTSIQLFSQHHVMTSMKRTKVQNEVSYVLEHMSKNISMAIGDTNQPAVTTPTIAGDPAIVVWIDANKNGRRDASPLDYQIAYSYNSVTHQIRYFSNYTLNPSFYEVLSDKISDFVKNIAVNYVLVQITSCWDPVNPPCGISDNPTVNMRSRIQISSVSGH